MRIWVQTQFLPLSPCRCILWFLATWLAAALVRRVALAIWSLLYRVWSWCQWSQIPMPMYRHRFLALNFSAILRELMISPVPSGIIILGYVAGGMTQPSSSALLWRPFRFFVQLQFHNVLAIVATPLLTSSLFCLAGLINGVYARNFDDISIIPTFVLRAHLSWWCVLFAIAFAWILAMVSKVNPIVYMVSGFNLAFWANQILPLAHH